MVELFAKLSDRRFMADNNVLKAFLDKGAKNRSKFIQVCIKDSGIGIKRQDLKRIFKPFEQADNSASRRYEGTGLGLSLTRNLVELHRGKIWAECPGEGRGSTFKLILPVFESGQSFARQNSVS